MRSLSQLFRALIRPGNANQDPGSPALLQKAMDAVMAPYRDGNYQAALLAAEGLRPGGGKPAPYCFFRGTMLMHLGHYMEAEKWLRESISREKEPQQTAIGYSTLGQLLIHQQRYEESLQCFATSLRHWPDRGSTHRDMAEALLHRGHLSKAFQCAKMAIDKDSAAGALPPGAYGLNMSANLATLAWAVAASSREKAEVDRLVNEAMPLVADSQVRSITAHVHYHSARAYSELGDAGRSGHHYEEAARIDPGGLWGRAARAMSSGAP